ncbi:MAG: polymerase sigma-70 factor, subfamily, partial [Gaiellaceae bacterium]|nr:polymerase sigma-70 factor, subfamily [Gaiellaceae bacterium]
MSTALAQAPPSDTTRRLYERHSSRIFGFCLSRLGSREDAEDAVQTTFLNAQRGLGRGVVPEYELAWLFKIAQNVCHNRHQSAKRRRCVESPHDLDSLQDLIASPERGAGASLGELTRALGTIPTRQRRALLLREFQGYSYEEIASELGTTVAAVETLVFRARRAMAQQLEQAGATQRRGRSAVAAVFELCRWLFRGGAAPLKVAAVAATVATATSLAIAPVGPDSTPAGPVAQKPEKVTAALPRPVQLRRLPDPSAPRRTSFRPRVVRDSTLPLAPSPVLTLPKPSAPAAPSRAS